MPRKAAAVADTAAAAVAPQSFIACSFCFSRSLPLLSRFAPPGESKREVLSGSAESDLEREKAVIQISSFLASFAAFLLQHLLSVFLLSKQFAYFFLPVTVCFLPEKIFQLTHTVHR